MTKISCFIASSLDNYISGPQDELDWLFQDQDYGYSAYYDSVDCIVMGARTYEVLSGFGDWPYPDKPCWIFSSSEEEHDSDNLHFVHGAPEKVIAKLEQAGYQHAWLVGGGRLIKTFRELDLIDDYILSWHPVLLGEGKPLFEATRCMQELNLLSHTVYDSGLLQVHYSRR